MWAVTLAMHAITKRLMQKVTSHVQGVRTVLRALGQQDTEAAKYLNRIFNLNLFFYRATERNQIQNRISENHIYGAIKIWLMII